MILIKTRIPAEVMEYPQCKGLKRSYKGVSDGTRYLVFYSEIDKYIHIRIIREDQEPISNYMDMQDIKNLLIGSDKIAIQVFPRKEDMINYGNTYHLWSWDDMEAPNLKELYNYLEE